ncbi:MAG: type II 3-dehydroquinate dehydratase [Gammaproteobacteria bacterium]|jgi:3-dehydroquinate dehydratase-2|nr:type II 3-dehydroquinate dehydratase [Gammaproteobacteria bacterium]MBT3722421.1 type II 3-dehydroquinate dehydratase [Gammaproteobacteria bacterium]MBT4196566.1 type II 3-dehydroquinate dehydratase [Gammaproteobacteria bacterium]MBT4449933.1 type II 3-dehydroquinate dehydratase [Gammaproteobacteria bacterium]MBT4862496.1 type II 3-dehydroquinate dehydratase [Gammaproteobacteria bacterium]
MSNILVIHGPNLNLLGQREPGHYGVDTLDSINQQLTQLAQENSTDLATFQSNHEGQIVDRIHQALQDKTDFIVINPAAFTHTSVAIRDAFLGCSIPFIEVHLSNVHAREEFRQHSFLSDIAVGVISGLGKESYLLALKAAISRCNK